MLRILMIIIIALLPTLFFVALIIWALGSFGYTPLAPLANSISHVAQPYVTPLLDKIRGLIGSLPGGPGAIRGF